jgi:transmembrane sensor
LADYRTGTGEQRQVALADDASLLLNTQTSVDVRPSAPGLRRIELIAGEAAISATASMAFDVVAAGGRAMASLARFDMRRDGATVRVTCLEGIVNVGQRDQSVTVPAAHQVVYDSSGLKPVLPVDLTVATAWQRGQLIFRHEPFARVVEEMNRYRPGRIILLNDKLGERDVVVTFHLSRIDEAVESLAKAFGAHTRFLPGGMVLLS